jgi:hypothetical protein
MQVAQSSIPAFAFSRNRLLVRASFAHVWASHDKVHIVPIRVRSVRAFLPYRADRSEFVHGLAAYEAPKPLSTNESDLFTTWHQLM